MDPAGVHGYWFIPMEILAACGMGVIVFSGVSTSELLML